MAEVIVNIKANTGQATNEVDDLNDSLNKTENSSEALSASLAKQEARVKTLDGAINLIGGSVELLAGGLALSGAFTEDQAEQFQTAAIGAIAFADGTKRVLDGYKSLNEGLAAYGGVAGKARMITLALNKAVLANPYIAAAVALATVTAAVLLWTGASEDEEQQNKDTTESINERTTAITNAGVAYKDSAEKLRGLEITAKFANQSIQDSIDKEKERIENAIASDRKELQLFLDAKNRTASKGEDAIKLLESQTANAQAKLQSDQNALTLLLDAEKLFTTGIADENAKRRADNKAYREEEEKANYEFYLRMLRARTDRGKETFEEFKEQLAKENAEIRKQAEEQELVLRQLPAKLAENNVEIADDFAESLMRINMNLKDFYEGENADAISATLATATLFANTLADVTGEGSEQAFEAGKKYKIASVVTSAIQAAFEAFGAAQQFGPVLGPILGAAQVGIIAAASNKAIGDIRSSTFGGSSTPNLGSIGGGGTPVSAAGGMGGSRQTLVTGVPTPETGPMRAYVVTGDVTSGQEAEAQLNTRRTFGPG